MVRVIVSVEGTCEEIFVKKTLAPYLFSRNIFLIPINIKGIKGIEKLHREHRCHLHQSDYLTTMYDFYGFKGKSTNDTKKTLEAKLLEPFDEGMRDRFIPYIQMHEFEALLFSQPEKIANHIKEPSISIWSKNILDQHNGNPETINDSPNTAPSKRLEIWPYVKTTHGPNILADIGICKLREACPGFNNWISSLESLQ